MSKLDRYAAPALLRQAIRIAVGRSPDKRPRAAVDVADGTDQQLNCAVSVISSASSSVRQLAQDGILYRTLKLCQAKRLRYFLSAAEVVRHPR